MSVSGERAKCAWWAWNVPMKKRSRFMCLDNSFINKQETLGARLFMGRISGLDMRFSCSVWHFNIFFPNLLVGPFVNDRMFSNLDPTRQLWHYTLIVASNENTLLSNWQYCGVGANAFATIDETAPEIDESDGNVLDAWIESMDQMVDKIEFLF